MAQQTVAADGASSMALTSLQQNLSGSVIAEKTTRTPLDSALDEFSSHGLSDLKNASLMDRVETKFVLPIHQFSELLEKFSDYYSVLEIDGHRVFNYGNTYLDTPDYKLYTMHHNGKKTRHKVRHRRYQETGTGFLEIKFKSNKSRVDKIRVRMDEYEGETKGEAQAFLKSGLGDEYQNLKPQQSCSYKRIALANEAAGERITIDFDLSFSRYQSPNVTRITDYFIVEVKQLEKDKSSPFLQTMESLAIRPSSFSKYCFGCYATAGSEIKQNRFKRHLQKYLAD